MRVAQPIEELHHTPQVEIVRSIEKGGYFLVIGEAQDVAERCLIIHCGIISRHKPATHDSIFIQYIETAEKEVQDTSCRESGGVPQLKISPKTGGYRGLIETISVVSQ